MRFLAGIVPFKTTPFGKGVLPLDVAVDVAVDVVVVVDVAVDAVVDVAVAVVTPSTRNVREARDRGPGGPEGLAKPAGPVERDFGGTLFPDGFRTR